MHLPLAAVEDRKDKFLEVKERRIYPEEIKEALYSDFQMASATTGYFRMSEDNGQLKLEVQLRKDKLPEEELRRKFQGAIAKAIKQDFNLILYPYKDFPYGMGLIYEQKFKYI
jgi:acyl-coenzyme A synthetase/AMP-(fatty) acid ligase